LDWFDRFNGSIGQEIRDLNILASGDLATAHMLIRASGTLKNGAVGISPFHNLDALVSAKVKADLEQIVADIIAGKIKTRP